MSNTHLSKGVLQSMGDSIENSGVMRFLRAIQPLGVALAYVALVIATFSFLLELEDRERDRIVRAWTVIALSPSAQGNIGQKEAVELLVGEGKSLNEVNLRLAHLVEADIPGASLWSANLVNANLEGANLRDAVLTRAQLNGAVLKRADLRGAKLQIAMLLSTHRPADLRNAKLQNADLRGADLRGAILDKANVSGTDFQDYEFEDVPGQFQPTAISKEQIVKACADRHNPPKLPDRPEFDGLKLQPCAAD